jgi:hypothetical protein
MIDEVIIFEITWLISIKDFRLLMHEKKNKKIIIPANANDPISKFT